MTGVQTCALPIYWCSAKKSIGKLLNLGAGTRVKIRDKSGKGATSDGQIPFDGDMRMRTQESIFSVLLEWAQESF